MSAPFRAPIDLSHPLLLASGSPRRREILGILGVAYVVSASAVDESTRPGELPAAYLERIVTAKLAAAPMLSGVAAVLVADTSVVDGDDILGKPESVAEAEAMVTRLAGKTHEVLTRFAIGDGATALHAETVSTRVTFRSLTRAQVQAYVATGEGVDKAGAYAVQGRGAGLVSRIEGSYSNVVGLPACEVVVALEHLGLLA